MLFVIVISLNWTFWNIKLVPHCLSTFYRHFCIFYWLYGLFHFKLNFVKKNRAFSYQTDWFSQYKERNAVLETSCGKSFLFKINEATEHVYFNRNTITIIFTHSYPSHRLSIPLYTFYFYGVRVFRVVRIISSSKPLISIWNRVPFF